MIGQKPLVIGSDHVGGSQAVFDNGCIVAFHLFMVLHHGVCNDHKNLYRRVDTCYRDRKPIEWARYDENTIAAIQDSNVNQSSGLPAVLI